VLGWRKIAESLIEWCGGKSLAPGCGRMTGKPDLTACRSDLSRHTARGALNLAIETASIKVTRLGCTGRQDFSRNGMDAGGEESLLERPPGGRRGQPRPKDAGSSRTRARCYFRVCRRTSRLLSTREISSAGGNGANPSGLTNLRCGLFRNLPFCLYFGAMVVVLTG
jgi:hypothetical protein